MTSDPAFDPSIVHPGPARRLCRRILNRQGLFIVASLFTLVALFYVVENWRGKQAWEKYKRELEAKGEKLNLMDHVPAPVPDGQNIMKVPLIEAWFSRETKNTHGFKRLQEMCGRAEPAEFSRKGGPLVVVEFKIWPADSVVPGGSPTTPAEKIYRLDELNLKNEEGFRRTLREIAGVAILSDPVGGLIVKTGAKPARIQLRLDGTAERAKIEKVIKDNHFLLENTSDPTVLLLRLGSSGIPAEDFLARLAEYQAELDQLAEAFKRPYARFGGDYIEPFTIPIPSFFRLRALAQTMAAAAQAHLLVGRPDAAFHDLGIIAGLVNVLKGSQPTLVTAMIRVAIAGLYVSVAADGLEEGLWGEPQRIGLQEQLRGMELLSDVAEALRGGERDGVDYTIERTSRAKLAGLFGNSNDQKWKRPIWLTPKGCYFLFAPRGWFYQNELNVARLFQTSLDAVNTKEQRIDPHIIDGAGVGVEEGFRHITPYNFLAEMIVPNFRKAWQSSAKNQTFVSEATLACALERFRAAQGDYPEKLGELVPRFIDKLPHDLVTGGQFQYRHLDKNDFILYAVGWDGKDDGGISNDYKDWVWPMFSPDSHPRKKGH